MMDLTNNKGSDREDFALALTAMASAFGTAFDRATIKGYAMGLGDLTIDQFKLAVGRSIRELKFLPKVSEIRARVPGLVADPEQRAAVAWAAAQKLHDQCNWTSDDPITLAVVRAMGGLAEFSMRKKSGLEWCLKDFLRLYVLYTNSGIRPDQCERLVCSKNDNYSKAREMNPEVPACPTTVLVTNLPGGVDYRVMLPAIETPLLSQVSPTLFVLPDGRQGELA